MHRQFRIRKNIVRAFSKISPSASNVLCAGGGIATFPSSDRSNGSLCKTFQARNRLCFDASSSSSKSWIAFGVIDIGQGFMRTLIRPNHLQLLRASSSDSVYKLSDPNSRGQNSRKIMETIVRFDNYQA